MTAIAGCIGNGPDVPAALTAMLAGFATGYGTGRCAVDGRDGRPRRPVRACRRGARTRRIFVRRRRVCRLNRTMQSQSCGTPLTSCRRHVDRE